MKSYRKFKRKLLKDKEIKQAYDELELEFEIAKLLIQRRVQKGLTQKELASKLGTTQSAIARLESGSYNPSISFLTRVASALDSKLTISI